MIRTKNPETPDIITHYLLKSKPLSPHTGRAEAWGDPSRDLTKLRACERAVLWVW